MKTKSPIKTAEGGAETPMVFTRLITTPPGLPWDQARIAQLEATRSAPIAMSSLTLRLKRLNRWRNGAQGRYAALYVKTEELGAGFTTSVSVDGQTIAAEFKSRAQAAAEARRAMVLLGSGGIALVLAISLMFAVGAARVRAEHKLDELDRLASRQLRQAEAASALKRQSAALQGIAEKGAPLSDVLADLAWASKSRVRDTPIEAFHWRTDAFGVEVRGDAAPFPGGDARRLDRPLRTGVWLWAMTRDAHGGDAAR